MQTTFSLTSFMRTGISAVAFPFRAISIIWNSLRDEINSVYGRDPAARNAFEIITCYAGLDRRTG